MSLANKLTQERRARLSAERLLEQKQAELFSANQKLGAHAKKLSEEIVETRAEVKNVRDENQRVKSDLSVAHKKIEIAERRLWASIEAIEDGFSFFNAESEMIIANKSYLAVFEELEEAKTGLTYVRMLQLLTEEGIVDIGDVSPAAWRARMLERWQSQSPAPETIRLWNGQYVKLIDQRGHGGDVVSLAHNITESVNNERDLREARDKAEAAARAKSAFLANMSHEIRTPMNGVVGMADLLIETEMDEEQKLFAQTIKNSGEALLVIINDVLDYSKLDAEKMLLLTDSFDLENAIHEVVMLLQPVAQEKGIAVAVDYDLFLPTQFDGDVGRIRQVLTNLVGNAIKFTGEGHVLVRVVGVGDAAQKTTQLHITVEDTGIGIPQEKLGHVFGEFNQVDDATNRSYEGTGLGLAISQKLIRMMGGEIWVDSEVGKGSSFGFKINLATLGKPESIDAYSLEGLSKAIVLERSEQMASLISRQLTTLGLGCHISETVEDVLKAAAKGADVVLADSEMAGYDLVSALADAEFKGAVVLLTSQLGAFQKQADTELAIHQLAKPISRRKLLEKLETVSKSMKKSAPQLSVVEQEADAKEETPATAPSERAMRVLAAEDNKTNRLVFQKLVKPLDIDLKFAENGKEAVELYQSFAPDMIFMDVSMPEMDGKEATRAIRGLEGGNEVHVPIFALTAHAMNGDKEEILSCGMDHFLTKPLRKAEIFAAIGRNQPSDARDVVSDA